MLQLRVPDVSHDHSPHWQRRTISLDYVQLFTAVFLLALAGTLPFREILLSFVHHYHPTAQKHLIEMMPGGVAVFDYNNDGRPDIFFTNGAAVPSLQKGPDDANRLFRNDGNLKFTDVTQQAGLAGQGYAIGTAVADYDNDGNVDVFVAGVFRNTLYRNRGDGTFEDVSARAGIGGKVFAVGGGWFDYDNDGNLDLFIVNYARWSPAFDKFCGDPQRDIRVYCHPRFFEGLPSTLYHNRGDGTFEDVSVRSGIAAHPGRGMSVSFADYDGDGFLDAFVANDKTPNSLFHNKRGKGFEEVALLAGVALPLDGKAISSMGADFRDYNNDGLPDINVTALNNETFPVFKNIGKGMFEDVSFSSKLGPLSARYSGWSSGFFDFDNDGWKDIYTANSHVNDRIEAFESVTYKQPNSLFLNREGQFSVMPFGSARAHRGGAVADFDGDGKLDIVITALEDNAELWHNQMGGGHWLDVRLRGTSSNRDGIGAVVRVNGQTNLMTSAVGYASSSHTPVHFGLGTQAKATVEITWPSGIRQRVQAEPVDRVLQVTEPAR